MLVHLQEKNIRGASVASLNPNHSAMALISLLTSRLSRNQLDLQ
jgi:hypothetical protein